MTNSKLINLTILLVLGPALAVGGCRRRTPTVDPGPRSEVCEGDAGPEDVAGCDLVLAPYPRFDDPDTMVFNDLPIQLYFFPQTPPAGTEILGPIRAKAVVANSRGSCRETGIAGLHSLQRRASRHPVNAVVNIRATWRGEQLGDDLRFGCFQDKARHVLIWEGALAKIPEDEVDTDSAGATPSDGQDTETAARLRKLQNLYYQGLITREEFIERRDAILGEL